jgi:hypothetical protein
MSASQSVEFEYSIVGNCWCVVAAKHHFFFSRDPTSLVRKMIFMVQRWRGSLCLDDDGDDEKDFLARLGGGEGNTPLGRLLLMC